MWRVSYEEGEDDVAEIPLGACHGEAALRLLCEPLALLWDGRALHFGCSRGVRVTRSARGGLRQVLEASLPHAQSLRYGREGLGGNERMLGARHAHQPEDRWN